MQRNKLGGDCSGPGEMLLAFTRVAVRGTAVIGMERGKETRNIWSGVSVHRLRWLTMCNNSEMVDCKNDSQVSVLSHLVDQATIY